MCVTHLNNSPQNAARPDCREYSPEDHASFSYLYETDEFRMYAMKVLPCSKRIAHNWQTCVFAHFGEKARRRNLRTHQYSSQLCPDVKREGGCPRGDDCPLSHNIFESWLHPELYRTQMCTSGTDCTRTVCFFAHTPDQLRVPSNPSKQQLPASGMLVNVVTATAADAKQQQQNAMLRANVAAAAAAAVKDKFSSSMAVPNPQQQQQQWGSNTLATQHSSVQVLLPQQLAGYSNSAVDNSSSVLHQLLPMVSSSSSMVCSSPVSVLDSSNNCIASQAMNTLDTCNITVLPSPMSSASLISPVGPGYSNVINVNNTSDSFASALQQLLVAKNTPAGAAAAAPGAPAGLLSGALGSPMGLASDPWFIQPAAATATTLLQQQQEQIQHQRLMLLQQEQQLQQQQALLQQLQCMNLGPQPVVFN